MIRPYGGYDTLGRMMIRPYGGYDTPGRMMIRPYGGYDTPGRIMIRPYGGLRVAVLPLPSSHPGSPSKLEGVAAAGGRGRVSAATPWLRLRTVEFRGLAPTAIFRRHSVATIR